MSRLPGFARCTLVGLALLSSPVIVVFIAPLGIGIVADTLHTAGPMLCAAALEAAAALLLLRCLKRQGGFYAAAKSIT